MITMKQLMDEAFDMDASDIHVMAGDPPVFRLHGSLIRREGSSELTPEDSERLVHEIAPERALMELEEVHGADFAYAYEDKCRFRVAAYRQRRTLGLSLRLIPYKLMTFEELGLRQESVKPLMTTLRGLVLVTGPTGSGKSTTLATMIDHINSTQDVHIITVEDPIEYYHYSKKSLVTQREVGVDVPTFAEGTMRAMRMDPDVILVGEMRDLNTIQAAITAAETGHLVFGTLHTTGATRTVERIVDVFPTEQQAQIRTQLGGNLLAVISQLLLRRSDKPGRVAAYEIMIATIAIRNLIRERKPHAIFSSIQTGQKEGMQTLDQHLLALYEKKLIDKQTVIQSCQQPIEVLPRLGEKVEEE